MVASVLGAIEEVLAAREVRTPDLGGSSTTAEVADALLAALAAAARAGRSVI